MKKKIICLILALFTVFIGINSVSAVMYGIGSDGNIYVYSGAELTKSEECQWGGYNGISGLNAVRITIVDGNGNRVSKSVDFTSSGSGTGTNYQSTEMKTRNEIINGGMSYSYMPASLNLVPWANLPQFVCDDASCGGTLLKNFFLNIASTNMADMMWLFGLLEYDGYKNSLLYENHYLLVEPIFNTQLMTPVNTDTTSFKQGAKYIYNSDAVNSAKKSCAEDICISRGKTGRELDQCKSYLVNHYSEDEDVKICVKDELDRQGEKAAATKYRCDKSFTRYYGTATEIFYMMKNLPEPLQNYNYNGNGNSFGTIVSNIGGLVHDDAPYVGGLIDASGIVQNKSMVISNMISNFGLGTMHVWMKYIMEGCPDGVCPSYCPDGVTEIPAGQTAEEVCPPSYCPDMQTVIPPGKTAAEVCPNYTPTCKYDLKTKITNDCTDGQEGFIRDIGEDENGATNLDEWKCIFDTANAPRNTYEGEFYHPNGSTFFDNNPYCRVACRETVKYKLPSTFEEVAGRRFTIGISNDFTTGLTPNVIEGTTTCSTAYAPGTEVPAINYELFKQHYANANITVVNTWNAYQNAVAKEKAFQAAQPGPGVEKDEACIGPLVDDMNSCPGGWSEVLTLYGIERDASSCAAWDLIKKPTDPGCSTSRTCPGGYGKRVDTANCNSWEDGNPKYTEYKWTGTYDNGVYKATVEYITTSCGHHGQDKDARWNEIQNEKNAAKAAYEAAVEQRRVLLKVLNMCNNFQRTYSEFEPTLSFAYSETKYRGSHKLAATSQTTAVTNYLVNNQSVGIHEWSTAGYEGSSDTFKVDMLNNYGSIDYIDRTDCNNELQPCVNNIKAQPFPNNISVIQTTRKTYNYEIPNDANRYVAKNGVSYNTAYDAELSDYPYIDTGRSNMPINYTTPGGWYHYYYDYYYANGTANLFGTNQKFLKYNKIEPGGTSSYNGLTLADNLLYHCIYKVDCGLLPCNVSNTCPDGSEMPPDGKCPDYTIEHRICPSGVPMPISGNCPDNKGINIIYRTISLNDPFPGEHGEGRDAGANWNGTATVLGTRMSFIDAYITNNRGVSTEKVYQETPMYQFTLTPANIRAIRKYNRSTGNDYNDYNFECSNGKYCKSEFLEEGIGNGYFGFSSKNPNGGSCFNAYSTDWESCRYSSIGG